MFEVVKGGERDRQEHGRKNEGPRAPSGTCPIGRAEEEKPDRQQGHDRELEEVRRRPFVRRQGMAVSAQHGKEGHQREEEKGDSAQAIQARGVHGRFSLGSDRGPIRLRAQENADLQIVRFGATHASRRAFRPYPPDASSRGRMEPPGANCGVRRTGSRLGIPPSSKGRIMVITFRAWRELGFR
jgi:hypothetical protein